MKNLLFSVLFIAFGLVGYGQYTIPPKPSSDLSLVFNYSKSNVISPSEQQQLNQKLIDYEATTSTQIVLVIVDSLAGEDPNFLAANWGQKWGIGQGKEDNGLLMLMSVNDRKIAIQNGYGLEEFMTDAKSSQVINNFIIPYFKQGQFYEGFDHGIDAIQRVLEGKFVETGSGYESNDDMSGLWFFLLLLLGMFFIFWLLSRRNDDDDNNGSGNRRRGALGDVIFTDFGRSTWTGRSGGFGGGFGGGGSFGGGGFGGFGGGGFGGGGASGSW